MVLLGYFSQDRMSNLIEDCKERGRLYQCILSLDTTFGTKLVLFLFLVGGLCLFLLHILAEEI